MTDGPWPGISLDVALTTARGTLASVAEEARQGGYYPGARTSLINAHGELRAALDMLIKAVGRDDPDPDGDGGGAAPAGTEHERGARGRDVKTTLRALGQIDMCSRDR